MTNAELADAIRGKISELNDLLREAANRKLRCQINSLDTRRIEDSFDTPLFEVQIEEVKPL